MQMYLLFPLLPANIFIPYATNSGSESSAIKAIIHPFYSLNLLCAEDKQVSLMSSVHHQPKKIISSGPFLQNPLN